FRLHGSFVSYRPLRPHCSTLFPYTTLFRSLVEFAERCFIYTMRGPVGMINTARGPMKSYKPDAQENNPPWTQRYVPIGVAHPGEDRKSTRLNSSHQIISYAVFCLKKKTYHK